MVTIRDGEEDSESETPINWYVENGQGDSEATQDCPRSVSSALSHIVDCVQQSGVNGWKRAFLSYFVFSFDVGAQNYYLGWACRLQVNQASLHVRNVRIERQSMRLDSAFLLSHWFAETEVRRKVSADTLYVQIEEAETWALTTTRSQQSLRAVLAAASTSQLRFITPERAFVYWATMTRRSLALSPQWVPPDPVCAPIAWLRSTLNIDKENKVARWRWPWNWALVLRDRLLQLAKVAVGDDPVHAVLKGLHYDIVRFLRCEDQVIRGDNFPKAHGILLEARAKAKRATATSTPKKAKHAFTTDPCEVEVTDPVLRRALLAQLFATSNEKEGERRVFRITRVLNPQLWQSYQDKRVDAGSARQDIRSQALAASAQTEKETKSDDKTVSVCDSTSSSDPVPAPVLVTDDEEKTKICETTCALSQIHCDVEDLHSRQPERTACVICEQAKCAAVVDEDSDPVGLERMDLPIHEEWVFHGTSPESVGRILRTGFQAQYSKSGSQAYGPGTYFASKAGFSLDAFTPPIEARSFDGRELDEPIELSCLIMARLTVSSVFMVSTSKRMRGWSLTTALAVTSLDDSSDDGRIFIASDKAPVTPEYVFYFWKPKH